MRSESEKIDLVYTQQYLSWQEASTMRGLKDKIKIKNKYRSTTLTQRKFTPMKILDKY